MYPQNEVLTVRYDSRNANIFARWGNDPLLMTLTFVLRLFSDMLITAFVVALLLRKRRTAFEEYAPGYYSAHSN
jgi:hypothetical protein